MAERLTLTEQGDILVAELRGEIDRASAREIDASLRGSVPNTALGIVIDLSHVTWVDSSALQMLFGLARWLGRREQRLQIVVPDRALVARELRVAEIEAAAGVSPTVPEALAELRAGLARPSPEPDPPAGAAAVDPE